MVSSLDCGIVNSSLLSVSSGPRAHKSSCFFPRIMLFDRLVESFSICLFQRSTAFLLASCRLKLEVCLPVTLIGRAMCCNTGLVSNTSLMHSALMAACCLSFSTPSGHKTLMLQLLSARLTSMCTSTSLTLLLQSVGEVMTLTGKQNSYNNPMSHGKGSISESDNNLNSMLIQSLSSKMGGSTLSAVTLQQRAGIKYHNDFF